MFSLKGLRSHVSQIHEFELFMILNFSIICFVFKLLSNLLFDLRKFNLFKRFALRFINLIPKFLHTLFNVANA